MNFYAPAKAKFWLHLCLIFLTPHNTSALAAGDGPVPGSNAPVTCELAARNLFRESLANDEWLLENVYKAKNPFVLFIRKFTRGREPDWKKFNSYYSQMGDHRSLTAWEKDLANRLAGGKASTEELLAFSARKIPRFRKEIERFAETGTRLKRAIFMRSAADFEPHMIVGDRIKLKNSSKDLDAYLIDLLGAVQTAGAGKEPNHWRLLPTDWLAKTLSRKQDRVMFLKSLFEEIGRKPTASQMKKLKLKSGDLNTSFEALRKHLEDTAGRKAQKDYYWLKAKALFRAAFFLGAPYLLEKAGAKIDTASQDAAEKLSSRERPIDAFIPQFEETLTEKTVFDSKDKQITTLRESLIRENPEAFAKIGKLRTEPPSSKRDQDIRAQIDLIKARSPVLYDEFHFKIMDQIYNDQEMLEKLKK